MIRFLLGCLLWGLGYRAPQAATSSGFGADQLVPSRERSGPEAVIRALSSVLFVWAIVAQFLPSPDLLASSPFHLLALTGALWSLLTILRPSLPMDSAAIGTALWSFAGYLPYFLLGNLTDIPVTTLLTQAGLVGALATYGIIRDIRRDIRAEKG